MKAIAPDTADSDPLLQRLIVESREQLPRRMLARERLVEPLGAAAFVAAASALALLGPSGAPLDPALALALVGLYSLATRVEFQIGSGWTDGTQVVFVAMLLLLPTASVPLLVALGLLLGRVPEYLNGEVHPARAALRVCDAWYSIWPTLVLLLAGATAPEWADWPIYLLALGAQFSLDLLTTAARVSFELQVPPRVIVDELRVIYLSDALLSPIGLLIAFAAVEQPPVVLCALPVLALLAVFGHERQARLTNAGALADAYRGTAHLLGEVLTDSDAYTGAHSRSVVVLCHQVGGEMGLDEGEMRDLEFGALLHDVGKMAVPSEILNKPGKLTADEFRVMRTHADAGAAMLERIGGVLEEVGAVVRTHHEWYDGSGYPRGLSGDEIPIAARIISACDAFNAMVTDRPYREALSVEAATAELRDNAGTQFDPQVVETLIALLERGGALGAEPEATRRTAVTAGSAG